MKNEISSNSEDMVVETFIEDDPETALSLNELNTNANQSNNQNKTRLKQITRTCFKSCNVKSLVPDVLCDRTVQLTCWLYAILGFLWVIYEEVFPLWSLNSPESGGLSFTQRYILF
jgi:hypothetical protein